MSRWPPSNCAIVEVHHIDAMYITPQSMFVSRTRGHLLLPLMSVSLVGGPLAAVFTALLVSSGFYLRDQHPPVAPVPALPQEVQVTCHCPARDCEPCRACEPCIATECSAWNSGPILPVVTSSAGFALGLAWGIVLGACSVGAAVFFCPRRHGDIRQSNRGLVSLHNW